MAAAVGGVRGRVVGSILVGLIAVVCIRLGFWQLARLQEKRERNAAVHARAGGPAVELASTTVDSTGLIFRAARATGVYDDERSIILPGRSFRSSPGVLVLTPLRLPGAAAVLVQRGWVPSRDAVNINLGELASEGGVTVDGVIIPFLGADNTLARRAAATAPVDTFRRVWYAIDEERLRSQFPYPLLPVILQRLPGTDSARLPVPQPVPALDEGPHLGYAIQWFSFAGIFVIGWIVLLRGRERSARQPGGGPAPSASA